MSAQRVLSINGFLRSAQKLFLSVNEHQQPVNIVMGNEASDLDSVASAIAYAWFLSHRAELKTMFVPVLNIPRDDIALRGETPWLLQRCGVDQSLLVCLDEFDMKQLSQRENTQVYLMDHNKLAHHQQFLQPLVAGIIDHHVDEKIVYPSLTEEERWIIVTGSASSMVALRIHQQLPQLLRHREAWPFSQLLTAAIVVDTQDMNPSYGKGTAIDQQALDVLSDRRSFLDQLQYRRSDVTDLTTLQLLRKDLKAGRVGSLSYGIASVPLSMDHWMEKDAKFREQWASFASSQGYDVLLVMTAFGDADGKHHRQLAVVTGGEQADLFDEVCAGAPDEDSLRCEPIMCSLPALADGGDGDGNCGGCGRCAIFEQGNTKSSRKVVLPWLVRLLEARQSRGSAL